MALVDPNGVVNAAYKAGFRGTSLIIAVATAFAESHANPMAHNSVPPDDSYGAWQINYYGPLAQSRTQQYGPATGQYDLYTNAKTAYSLSGGGTNFNAWSVVKSGSYLSQVPAATDYVNRYLGGSAMAGSIGSPSNIFAPTTTPSLQLTAAVKEDNPCVLSLPVLGCVLHRSNLRAIGGGAFMAAGVVLMLAGIALLVSGTSSGLLPYSKEARLWETELRRRSNRKAKESGEGVVEETEQIEDDSGRQFERVSRRGQGRGPWRTIGGRKVLVGTAKTYDVNDEEPF